jgi:hypothetical protein
MRGEVEVWRGKDLVLKEPNMLVNGAGELLADIMTVTPSLSGITDHATSSILDASNYRVNAISFGTGSDAFRSNAHNWDDRKEELWEDSTLSSQLLAGDRGTYIFLRSPIGDRASVYQPADVGYPVTPNPDLDVLEENTDVSGSIFYIPASRNFDVSAIVKGTGQLMNMLPSAILSSVYADSVLDDSYVYASKAAGIIGCFPEGSSAPFDNAPNSNSIFYYDNAGQNQVSPGGGFFNEVSSMDASGFVNMVMSSVPHVGLNFSGGASGLCLSAEIEQQNEGFPFVEYTVSLAAADCIFAHAYGGIAHLGLWSIDMNESLINGNTPPFEFSVLNNPRKYKLFCRKGLSKDITYSEDRTQNSDLTIKWRIHFR